MTDQTPFVEQASEDTELDEPNLYLATLFWVGVASFILAFILYAYGTTQYDGGVQMAIGASLVPFGGLSMLLWLTVHALGRGK